MDGNDGSVLMLSLEIETQQLIKMQLMHVVESLTTHTVDYKQLLILCFQLERDY